MYQPTQASPKLLQRGQNLRASGNTNIVSKCTQGSVYIILILQYIIEINEHKFSRSSVVDNPLLHKKDGQSSVGSKNAYNGLMPSLHDKRLSIMMQALVNAPHFGQMPCLRQKGTTIPPYMSKFKYWLNIHDTQAKNVMVLITWAQIQVSKFNIDSDVTSTSQEQPRLYVYGVSFASIYPQTLRNPN